MRLPWISRSVHQQALESALALRNTVIAERDRERAALADLQARYDTLLTAHLAYLRPVITGSEGHPAPTSSPRPRSPIEIAIRDAAGGDVRLANYFRRRAQEIQRENPDLGDDAVAAIACQWSTTEDSKESS